MNIYLAKQPIFTAKNNTYGYELLFRNNRTFNKYRGTNGDKSTADVIINAFFDLNTREILSGKKAFINFTEDLIRRGIPKLLPSEDLVVEILEDVAIDAELLGRIKEFKELGYLIALDKFTYKDEKQEIFALADIVKIDFQSERDDIEHTAEQCRNQSKTILAEKVETNAEAEYAKSLGVTLIQGFYYAKPTIITKKSVNPMTGSFIKLIEIMNEPNPDLDRITAVISMDAALVLKLLRLVNSAHIGTKTDISTVKQAVMLLGTEPLREWIYLLGMNRLKENKSNELLKMSLMRAEFCRRIAEIAPGGKMISNEMHLMGLISLMNVFSDMTQEEMLAQLPVSKLIKDGLAGSGGIYGTIFELCRAYETANREKSNACAERLALDMSAVSQIYLSCAEFVKSFWNEKKG